MENVNQMTAILTPMCLKSYTMIWMKEKMAIKSECIAVQVDNNIKFQTKIHFFYLKWVQ